EIRRKRRAPSLGSSKFTTPEQRHRVRRCSGQQTDPSGRPHMRKLIIALALLATISAPAFAGRLSEATGANVGHDAHLSATGKVSGSAGAAAGATVGVR